MGGVRSVGIKLGTKAGTEWIASNDVNRKLLADRDTDAIPIKDGKEIRRLRPGSMSLLKGGT